MFEEIGRYKLAIAAFVSAGKRYAGAIKVIGFGELERAENYNGAMVTTEERKFAIVMPLLASLKSKTAELCNFDRSNGLDMVDAIIVTTKRYMSGCISLNPLQEVKIHHRDIKPENMLVDEAGNVLFGDLGTMLAVENEGHTDHFGTTYMFCNYDVAILGVYNRVQADPATRHWPAVGHEWLTGLVRHILPNGLTFALDTYCLGLSYMLDIWSVTGRLAQGINYLFHDSITHLWDMDLSDWEGVRVAVDKATKQFSSMFCTRDYQEEMGLFPATKYTFEALDIFLAPSGLHAAVTGQINMPPRQRLTLAYKALQGCVQNLERYKDKLVLGEHEDLYRTRAANLAGQTQGSSVGQQQLQVAVGVTPKTPKSPVKIAFAQALGRGDGHGDFFWSLEVNKVNDRTKHRIILKGHHDAVLNILRYYLPNGYILAKKLPVGYERVVACAWPGCTTHSPADTLAKAVRLYIGHTKASGIEHESLLKGVCDMEVPADCGGAHCGHHPE